ncbi:DUF551 domain-containing protein [Methylobacterium organophilum]|uniref:DUF551 domain-containing protein n=1 Tax=Methylobacterium organophilum TaxID=410 RepID=A0ABQ4TFF4_METOR|nr:DUF551 domain-containing protein [Methylobacterium organophilum]GJE29786.1 hypothetical protein LKMONMHP_4672 [Methylobacterium organophilum]
MSTEHAAAEARDRSGRVTILPTVLWRALDAEAEIWAQDTNIASWIAKMSSDARTIEKLDAIVRLCFEEGFYRGAVAAREGRSITDSIQEAQERAAPPAPTDGKLAEDWRKDPSADDRWNAGLDYGQRQLCAVLGVDPGSVSWDAATETLDGDVRSVIGNILTAWAGDEWRGVASPGEKVLGAGSADWKLVPLEPTPRMLAAAREAMKSFHEEVTEGWERSGSRSANRRKDRLRYRAMLAAAPTTSPAPTGVEQGWQPIATAPRDGSEIDLLWCGRRLTGYRWDAEGRGGGCWSDARDADRDWRDPRSISADIPTHWMPLPAPPAPSRTAEGSP